MSSRPFGIPTMQEMVTEFEKELESKDKECYEFYSDIKNTLIEKYNESNIDIESILSVLNGIVSEIKAKDLGYYAYYHIQEFCKTKNIVYPEGRPTDEYVDKATRTETLLKEFIQKSCEIKLSNSDIKNVYRKSYVPLFNNIEGDMQNYPGHELIHDWKAYTTNYDFIFENFWNTFESVKDNFQKDKNSNNHFFVDSDLEIHSLSKLHGSLDWTREIETDRILKKNNSSYNIYDTQGEVMLFPIQQKDLYLHPWFTLFSNLRKGLQEKSIWYVIGYAFNDEFILNTFQEILSNNSDKILVIINPDAKNIMSKFNESIRNQINLVPIKFGGEFFEVQFNDYKKSVKTLIVRIIPNNNEFTIKFHDNKIISSKIMNSEKSLDSTFNDKNTEIYCKTNSTSKEIQVKLEIEYSYGDKVKLSIRDNTEKLDFHIDYCDLMIASSHDVDGYVEHTPTWIEMKNPLILDESKLYRT